MHCLNQTFTVGQLWVERNVINDKPEYQRESAVWSKEKQQLFLDSILNEFDVPKLYFHDLRDKGGAHHFAVVDGKQRLHAIWQFIQGQLALADDFQLLDKQKEDIKASSKFGGLSENWRETFKSRALSVVLIQKANEEDIEELFSRLNNGEPLNAAEKRNAMGGDMCKLIREVAQHKFFNNTVRISNTRYQHLELAAKFLQIEKSVANGGSPIVDLKKRFLDALVKNNRQMAKAAQHALRDKISETLNYLSTIFGQHDVLLSKQAYAPLYYVWARFLRSRYALPGMEGKIRKFLENFQALRALNLEKPEDQRDSVLIEFGRLMQQGTNDQASIQTRFDILTRYFLLEHPEITVKDKNRLFSGEERYAIWILGGKQCAVCHKAISIDEMHADHHKPWAQGGQTLLSNGRCLCETHNLEAGGAMKKKQSAAKSK
jgi:hypothetical protein